MGFAFSLGKNSKPLVRISTTTKKIEGHISEISHLNLNLLSCPCLQPFTPPSVTPPTIERDRMRYTTMTGKIEKAIMA